MAKISRLINDDLVLSCENDQENEIIKSLKGDLDIRVEKGEFLLLLNEVFVPVSEDDFILVIKEKKMFQRVLILNNVHSRA